MCYVRPGLLHCCETWELTVADEATLHRVERCMIYIYYICIYHIIIYTIYSRCKVGLTWDLKPLDLCSDTSSTELASLTQERSITSMFTQEVTSKNTKLCLNGGNWAGLSPTLSTSTLAPRYLISTSCLLLLLHSPFLWG